MIREKIDASRERQILTLAISNTEFLKAVHPICKLELFKSGYARTVYSWVSAYFKEYEVAPQKDIQELYIAHKLDIDEDEEVIATFLQSLSDEEEEPNNIPFRVKEAEEWLGLRAIELLTDSLKDCLLRKDRASADEAIANYSRVTRVESDDTDVLRDAESAFAAFTDENEVLFQFPGPLGAVMGQFKRTDFVSFLAPMKRGKCVSGDTKVLLSDGRIERIDALVAKKEGEVVSIDVKNKILSTHISDFWDNGKKHIYSVTTRTGRNIKITKNHPLLSFEKGWVTIEEGLKAGDSIAVPRNMPIFGSVVIPEQHVRLIAYLLADGGLTSSCVTYTKKDPILRNDVIGIVTEMGDCWTDTGKYGISISKGYNSPHKSKTAQMLMDYGIPRTLSVEKTIPPIIFQLRKELISLFLRILFSGDGSVHRTGVDYSSGSKEMIEQVHHLLLRFGIVSIIREKKVKGNSYWECAIRDSQYIIAFLDEIGFIGEKGTRIQKIRDLFMKKKRRSYLDTIPGSYRKVLQAKMKATKYHPSFDTILEVPNVKWNISKEYLKNMNIHLQDEEVAALLNADVLWDPIKEITYAGIENTFDLTVPQYHNFMANDICVHNSMWLWDCAQQAVYSGCKVLFISMEMPKNQMLRRIWTALTKRPRGPKVVRVPYFVEMDESRDDKPMYKVEYEDRAVEGVEPTPEFFADWVHRFKKYFKGGDIKLKCIPAKTATVQDLATYLDNLEYYENWIPDVVVLDYADLMTSKVKGEERHKLDDIWSNLRRIALQREICIITASQANRAGIHEDLDMEHAAEDIRKVAHVTKMLGINATKEEKANGLFRISQIAERDDEAIFEQAYVTSCLSLGTVFLDSRYKSEVWVDKSKKE